MNIKSAAMLRVAQTMQVSVPNWNRASSRTELRRDLVSASPEAAAVSKRWFEKGCMVESCGFVEPHHALAASNGGRWSAIGMAGHMSAAIRDAGIALRVSLPTFGQGLC